MNFEQALEAINEQAVDWEMSTLQAAATLMLAKQMERIADSLECFTCGDATLMTQSR